MVWDTPPQPVGGTVSGIQHRWVQTSACRGWLPILMPCRRRRSAVSTTEHLHTKRQAAASSRLAVVDAGGVAHRGEHALVPAADLGVLWGV